MRDQPFGRVRLIEMVVESVRVHMLSSHVVILKESERDRYLPIWIGPAEANAIAMRLQGLSAERPLTHDLMVSVLSALNSSLSRVVVTHVTEGTFHARLYRAGRWQRGRDRLPHLGRDRHRGAHRVDHLRRRTGAGRGGVEPEQEDGDSDEKLAVFREFVNSLDVDHGVRREPAVGGADLLVLPALLLLVYTHLACMGADGAVWMYRRSAHDLSVSGRVTGTSGSDVHIT